MTYKDNPVYNNKILNILNALHNMKVITAENLIANNKYFLFYTQTKQWSFNLSCLYINENLCKKQVLLNLKLIIFLQIKNYKP